MSLARPARCLFCSFSRAASSALPRVPRRQFHPTPTQFSDTPKPKIPGPLLKTADEISRDLKVEDLKQYTEEEKAALKETYSAEQMAAVEAGEAAIDPKDMAEQFSLRRDPMRLRYMDDFSVIEPSVDKTPRAPISNSDYDATFKTEDDFVNDFARYFATMPENAGAGDFVRFLETNRVTVGKEENELNPHSSMVPDLFGLRESLSEDNKAPRLIETEEDSESPKEDLSEAEKRLVLATGYNMKEVRAMRAKVLVSHSIVNQTRMGKIRRTYNLAIAGNGNGMLGIGEAKSEDSGDAMLQAKFRAVRNMQPIPRYEGRTIFGDVNGKEGACTVKLMTRPPGFGVRCQHLVFEICRAAGIHDLAARVGGSRNKMNAVKATYQALMSQRNPEDIARARGKKLVDVRKVYYSGRSYQKFQAESKAQ